MINFTSLTPAAFFQNCLEQQSFGFLAGKSIPNAALANKKGGLLQGLETFPDYDDHEGVFYQADAESGCLFFAFIHNTNRGQAQGGTRMRNYDNMFDLLTDGLRLSKAMSEKCGIAGLWWGGGKAIICPVGQDVMAIPMGKRQLIFSNYGKFIARLHGAYIAAEDMNTTPQDMLTILSVNRFVTCIPMSVGGSGNPSTSTAEGVFKAMLATVAFFEQKDSLKGCSVAIQGLGNVGSALAKFALDSGASTLYVYDINQERINQLKSMSSNVVVMDNLTSLVQQSCDIFAPCAGGKVLNTEVIDQLNCKYVVGAANNQLDIPEQHAEQLQARGIHYLPDFFINRMGIINCANEQYGLVKSNFDHALDKVYADTLELLKAAQHHGISPHFVAMQKAAESLSHTHPIWPDQGKKIIEFVIDKA